MSVKHTSVSQFTPMPARTETHNAPDRTGRTVDKVSLLLWAQASMIAGQEAVGRKVCDEQIKKPREAIAFGIAKVIRIRASQHFQKFRSPPHYIPSTVPFTVSPQTNPHVRPSTRQGKPLSFSWMFRLPLAFQHVVKSKFLIDSNPRPTCSVAVRYQRYKLPLRYLRAA